MAVLQWQCQWSTAGSERHTNCKSISLDNMATTARVSHCVGTVAHAKHPNLWPSFSLSRSCRLDGHQWRQHCHVYTRNTRAHYFSLLCTQLLVCAAFLLLSVSCAAGLPRMNNIMFPPHTSSPVHTLATRTHALGASACSRLQMRFFAVGASAIGRERRKIVIE